MVEAAQARLMLYQIMASSSNTAPTLNASSTQPPHSAEEEEMLDESDFVSVSTLTEMAEAKAKEEALNESGVIFRFTAKGNERK